MNNKIKINKYIIINMIFTIQSFNNEDLKTLYIHVISYYFASYSLIA